jgi:hypothetical protein
MQWGRVADKYSGRLHDVRLDQKADKMWVDSQPVARLRALETPENTAEGIGAYGREDKSIPPGSKIIYHFRLDDLRKLPEGT